MPRDVEFDANGTTLRGWLYVPDGESGPFPAIVMTAGFTAVKEMGLDQFGKVFVAAGFACLIYDHRNTGASDGEPRGDIDPVAQARDYRHAITYLQSLPEVDEDRIGLWGTSYSGAEVIQVAAIDRRVKCVVSQTMIVSGWRNTLRLMTPKTFAARRDAIEADRRAQLNGAPPATIKMTTDNPDEPHAFGGERNYGFFTSWGDRAPNWRNACTVQSLDYMLEFDAGPSMPLVSPTPLLMVIGANDAATPPDESLAAYEAALEPKKLVLMPGDHYSGYLEDFELASGAARDWFLAHL